MEKPWVVLDWATEMLAGYLCFLGFVIFSAIRHLYRTRSDFLGWKSECEFWIRGAWWFLLMTACYLPEQFSHLSWRLSQVLPAVPEETHVHGGSAVTTS